jgi:hypothetical protein
MDVEAIAIAITLKERHKQKLRGEPRVCVPRPGGTGTTPSLSRIISRGRSAALQARPKLRNHRRLNQHRATIAAGAAAGQWAEIRRINWTAVKLGLGRSVALRHRSPALYQIH